VCVGEIISLPWFSKELKNDLSNNNCLRGVILILLIRESIFVGWGSPFPIVLVPRYKLSLCHTPIKSDLLGFSGIGIFACWLHDHVITRFASEIFYQCWDRYRDLFNTCPYHGFETWKLVSYFYKGLTPTDRQMVELMCNETFEDKDPNEAIEYLDLLAENAQN